MLRIELPSVRPAAMLRVLALFFLLSPLLASAQSGAMTGRVVDAESGRPLQGATVALESPTTELRGTTTDAAGHFGFEELPAETYAATIRFLGYEQAQRTVGIREGHTAQIEVALEPTEVALQAVEIIGSSQEAIRKLPGTATRLAPRTVQLIDPVGTQELLRHVPGVHGFADDGIGNARISIGIRGLNPRRSSRVLVLEDGIPIQPALYVYPNMYYNPPVARIDRVEVIKGSAAIEHGPQTMGGVINYITSRPRTAPETLARVTGGTNGYASLFLESGGWGSERLTPEVQLLAKRAEGFRENNGIEQFNGTIKLRYQPDDTRSLYLKANVNFEDNEATYTGLTPYTFDTDPTYNPKNHDSFRVFRTSLDLIYDRTHSSRLSSTTRAYLSYFDRDWWRENDIFVRPADLADGGTLTPVPWYAGGDLVRVGNDTDNFGILRTFYAAGVQRSYEWDHVLLGAQSSLDLGARLHFERFLDNRRLGDAPDARDGVLTMPDPNDPSKRVRAVNPVTGMTAKSSHFETTALSVYAQETLQWERLRVVPGVRVEFFEQEVVDRLAGSIYRDATSFVVLPGLGINYRLTDGLNAFGGVHRGYTPPSSGTISIASVRAGAEPVGIDVAPETSWNLEAGLRGRYPWLAFEATGFFLQIDDIVAAARGTAFRNLGSARSYGLEWGSTLRLSALASWLPDLNATYTWLQTEVLDARIESYRGAGEIVDVSGNELPYAPEHTLGLGLEKNFADRLTLLGELHYVSAAFTDYENLSFTTNRGDTGPIPAHTVVDASARYQVSTDLNIQLTAKNLLDNVYVGSRLHSNPRQPQAWLSSGILPGPRRQINLSLSYRF